MTRLLPLAPISEFVMVADPNFTSHTHPTTRLLPPTPITELGRTTNSNLTSYKLVANPNLTYHTRITSWPLTSYTHATIRFLPPTPIEELVLVATSASNLSHTHYDPAFAGAAAAARPPSAVFLRARYDPAPDTGSHHGARTGGASESHLSATPPLTTADPSATATSAATTLVASSSPDATEGSADHFSAPAPPAARDITATDASTTETPTAPPPPPFHVPDGDTDGALAASASPGGALGTADGVTADAASAAETGTDVDTDPVPAVTAPPTAGDTTATVLRAADPAHTVDGTFRGHKRNAASGNDDDADDSVATAGDAAGTASATAVPSSNERRKRRRSNQAGPAHAARRVAFMTAKEHGAADAT